jgi:hypothetical protein
MSKGDRMCNLDNRRELTEGPKSGMEAKENAEKTGGLPEEEAGCESWDDGQWSRHGSRRWLMEIPKGTGVRKTPWSRGTWRKEMGEREGGEASRHLNWKAVAKSRGGRREEVSSCGMGSICRGRWKWEDIREIGGAVG